MHDKLFEHVGNNPEEWQKSAEALVFNYEILAQHRRQHDEERKQYAKDRGISIADMTFASLLLVGYALECFFKCLHLKRGGHLAKNGKYTGWGRGHNLVWMATETAFPLEAEEQTALKHLSMIIKWRGRYPIATNANGTFRSRYWRHPEDDSIVQRLIDALRAKIDD